MKTLTNLALVALFFGTLACDRPTDNTEVTMVSTTTMALHVEPIANWQIAEMELPRTISLSGNHSDLTSALSVAPLRTILDDQQLNEVEAEPDFRVLESDQFRVRLNETSGRIHVRSKRSLSDALPGDRAVPEELREDSLRRLAELGIASEEVGSLEQRTIRRDLVDDDNVARSELMAHVTFVERQIAGVPVIGSRMVVMHDREGRLMKVMGWWPRIDVQHSRLNPELDELEASLLVTEELRGHQQRLQDEEGRTPANVVAARPVLVPTEQEDGSVKLNLEMEMEIRAPEDTEGFKPLQLRLDV